MTYCVALRLDGHLVFMSDTRTNAGIDNVSTFRKMFVWEVPGERVLTLMTAGNLATTQAVVSRLDERSKVAGKRNPSLLQVPTLFQAARLVGDILAEEASRLSGSTGQGPSAHQEVAHQQVADQQVADNPFGATLILGGQIGEGPPSLFLIYPEGNFVEAGPETPFFQIGETKYGRPILLRALDASMGVERALRLLCVSFDSTLQANLSVGMPLDVHVYAAGSLVTGHRTRIEAHDPTFQSISRQWAESLRHALEDLPTFELP